MRQPVHYPVVGNHMDSASADHLPDPQPVPECLGTQAGVVAHYIPFPTNSLIIIKFCNIK